MQNHDYFAKKDELRNRAREHMGQMEEKYGKEIESSKNRTKVYHEGAAAPGARDRLPGRPAGRPAGGVPENKISLVDADSVSTIFNIPENKKVCVLNFASYKNPGGMFMDGSSAQEECLCHASTLYNVISACGDYYEWNKKNLNKGLYRNRALYSPDILFFRDGKQRKCDVLTCAAPNKSLCFRYHSFSEEENSEALKSRIDFVMKIAQLHDIDVLVLGAWGCGVFKQDEKEVARCFLEAISKSPKNIEYVFAIPGRTSVNFRGFEEVFGNNSDG